MKDDIRIQLKLDASCDVPEVTIRASKETELVRQIISSVQKCQDGKNTRVAVRQDTETRFIDQTDIIRVFTEGRKRILSTEEGKFQIRFSLREVEEMLDPECFVRISRFEIINMNKVSGFDLSIAGTIKIAFEDGSSTFVARRYVSAIEKRLSEL